MSKQDYLAPLVAALRDLVAWLKDQEVPGLVIGGVAASFLGRPRLTRDVDVILLLDHNRWKKFLEAGTEFGFASRLADPFRFARKTGVLPVHHRSSAVDVDLVLGSLPFEAEAIAAAVWVEVSGVAIPLPTPEDLVIMKAVAHRPRDLADIEAIVDAHPRLNLRRVRLWVKEFAAAMERPEVLKDLQALLARRKKRRLRETW